MSVPVRELVVGDIIHVEQGDRVPADCVLVEEMNITTDQTMYHKDEVSVAKEESRHSIVDREN
jgi:Ca2+-transporting ATPase